MHCVVCHENDNSCGHCGRWQHAMCGGYDTRSSPTPSSSASAPAGADDDNSGDDNDATDGIQDDTSPQPPYHDNFNVTQPYRCPPCQLTASAGAGPVPGGVTPSPATLIVCPAVLLSQWESELRRHSQGLKITVCSSAVHCSCVLRGSRNENIIA